MVSPTGQLSSAHIGAVNEVLAQNWLLRQGYFVFASITVTGPADMVAWKPGEEPILIDVKTLNRRKYKDTVYPYAPANLTESQKAAGIKPLYVCPERNLVAWTVEPFNAAPASV